MITLQIIILVLLLLILCLFYFGYLILKKYKPISKTDKEFIIFVIDMYCKYSKELKINSEEHHDKIIKKLNEIKKEYFDG